MKYKLINKQTGEEHICKKVVIDGWDYYISGNEGQLGDVVIELYVDGTIGLEQIDTLNDIDSSVQKKVIATNNPNIDVPKVVDEVEMLAEKFIGCKYEDIENSIDQIGYDSFKRGYNKSQETHPFSEEDMKSFLRFSIGYLGNNHNTTYNELLQLWKEQRKKTLYYET